MLTQQQLATVLYALREVQDTIHNASGAAHFSEGIEPLTPEQIDDLCETLNEIKLIDEKPLAVNKNCLQGYQCPDCQSLGPFRIDTIGPNPHQAYGMSQSQLMDAVDKGQVSMTTYSAIWTDEGSVDTYGDTDFDETGETICMNCSKVGVLKDFRLSHIHTTEGFFNHHARLNNWSNPQQISVLLDYISNQQSDTAFKDYLLEQS